MMLLLTLLPLAIMEYTLEIPTSLIARFAALGYPDPLVGLHDAAKLLLGIGPEAWATITKAAAIQGITPAKVVLTALNSPFIIQSPAEPEPQNLATRRARTAERDAAIVQDYAAGGITQAGLATKYDLSVVRITQILAKHRADTAVSLTPNPLTSA